MLRGMNDGNQVPLTTLSSFLHRLSLLALVFVPAALYFQFRAFQVAFWSAVADREAFVSNFLVSLSLWGFYMALQSLADPRCLRSAAIAQTRRAQGLIRKMGWVLAVAGIATSAFGLGLLVLVGDQLQGVAIICFGVGLVGLARAQIDRLRHVLALPVETEPVPPPPALSKVEG